MKIALISDIHGNAIALEAVLRDLNRHQIDQIIVLGDIAFRGPEPKRALSLLQSQNCTIIGGNADEWVVRGISDGEVPAPSLARMRKERKWTVDRLNNDDLNLLAGLPTTHTFWFNGHTSMVASHATPTNRFKVILPDAAEEEALPIYFTRSKNEQHLLAAYGHIHLPFVRFMNGSVLINPGSVGMPFDHNPMSSYALVEYTDGQFAAAIRRVAYPVELAVEALSSASYPYAEPLAACYRQGVKPS